MSLAIMIALLASPAAPVAGRPVSKNEIICSMRTVPNSRFQRKECITKSNAAKRTRMAEQAWRDTQNATGFTPNEGPSG